MKSSKEGKKQICDTPIADFLIQNSQNLKTSFHALPISHIRSNANAYKKYKKVFGEQYFSMETTITGRLFDSFFYPTKCIKKAQNYAADLFGANDTLFLTCGTSISNYIVVDALVDDSSNILVDRELHQSLHFAIRNKGANFDYFYSEQYCALTERKFFDIENVVELVTKAKQSAKPYDIIIMNAASYDGVICNIYEAIKRITEVNPKTIFIIDEAWSSAFYFHEELYKYTAGYAAKMLNNSVSIVSTQSAHKSLMALRQASLIHSFAGHEITEKLYQSRFKYHSTSPSYPILASIDLARSLMQNEGAKLLKTAGNCAQKLRNALSSEDELKPYQLHQPKTLSETSKTIFIDDPLKIHLNIRHLNMKGPELQEYLYHNHGIYFNRYTETTALINIHIGISDSDINNIIKALKSIIDIKKMTNLSAFKKNDFVIAYPPGIPIYAPGETITSDMHLCIAGKINSGLDVFQLS